jgi:hypothetical protein
VEDDDAGHALAGLDLMGDGSGSQGAAGRSGHSSFWLAQWAATAGMLCRACWCGRTCLPTSRARTRAERFLHGVYAVASGDRASTLGAVVQNVLVATVFFAIAILIVETLPRYRAPSARDLEGRALAMFRVADYTIAGIFSLEYVVRLLTCVFEPTGEGALGVSGVESPGAKRSHRRHLGGAEAVPGGDAVGSATGDPTSAGPAGWRAALTTFRQRASRLPAFVVHPSNLIDVASFISLYVRLGVGIEGEAQRGWLSCRGVTSLTPASSRPRVTPQMAPRPAAPSRCR